MASRPIQRFEIVGLYCPSEGRSCTNHMACGMTVLAGDLVLVKKEQLVMNGRIEDVGAVYRVVDGAVSCKIGYLPRVLSFLGRLDELHGQYAQVTELYALSSNMYKVLKDANMQGMAACSIVNQAGAPLP